MSSPVIKATEDKAASVDRSRSLKLPPLWESALGEGVELVSFDLFDTLLVRTLGSPRAVFLEVGKQLAERGAVAVSAEVFARFRGQAEDRARLNSPRDEVSLPGIYEELSQFFDLPGQVAPLIELEEEIERNCIVVLPGMKELVEQVRSRVGRVCFTTDIYLSEELILEILESEGIWRSGDRLYVSSTHGVQKFGTGGLFRCLLENEKLSPGQVTHCGNSLVNDIEPARRVGLRVLHLGQGNPVASETLLEDAELYTEGVSGRISAAARMTRFEGGVLEGDERAAWMTGASVAGPLAYCYARWVMATAKRHGLTHLLFLARDAHFPYQAVERLLARDPGSDLKICYFYGSRPTYYALSVERLGESEWDALTSFAGTGYNSLSSLIRVLMVSGTTLAAVAEAVGIDTSDPFRKLSEGELKKLKMGVVDSEENQERCLRDIREYHDWMRQLLKGEGIDAGSRVGLVDTGWTTKSHAPFFRFVEESGNSDVRLLYLGLAGTLCAVPSERVDTFLFNQHKRTGSWLPGFDYARPMESLFMAPHGRTERFVLEDGEVKPCLAPLENPEFLEKFYEPYEGAISAFLDKMVEQTNPSVPDHGISQVASEVIHRYWNEPSVEEARLWSQLSWEWDPLGEVRFPLAQAYSFTDVLGCLREGQWPAPHPQFWVGGARKLSAAPVIFLMRAALAGRRVIKNVIQALPGGLSTLVTRLARRLGRLPG